MAVAQIILFLDSAGTIRAEMPGQNGNRQKVELNYDFATRNPEITALLRDELDRQTRLAEKMADLKARNAEIRAADGAMDQVALRRAQLAEDARRCQEWLASLAPGRRKIEEDKLDKKLKAAVDRANSVAKGLYHYVVENHGITLAKRVIPNAARRPGKKILISTTNGMKEFSPRKDEIIETKSPRAKRVGPIDLTLAIDL
jgi:Skp family chaperone for outer membrane proteins